MKAALIIFVKNAEPGKVKTRIGEVIGANAALIIYQRLLEHTMLVAQDVHANRYVYYSDHVEDNDSFSAELFHKRVQVNGDLGDKIKAAFGELFLSGYEQVCIIGSDCLELQAELISTAFESLRDNDVVLGPAIDGGYYLVGMRNNMKPLFNEIAWSTNEVFNQTVQCIKEQELSYYLLPVLSDVDTVNDLPTKWKQEFISIL